MKGSRLRGWWSDWAGCGDASTELYPEIDADALSPTLGVAPDPDRLYLFEVEPSPPRDLLIENGLGPCTDAGDRALICDAVRANVPAILTTDVRSFWTHRAWLFQQGIEVWRPCDLWLAIDPRMARSTVT